MRIYVAFVDPSGGSSDSMTWAVAHLSFLKRAVLDGVWERKPPFSPENVVEECAAILKEYAITIVVGDRYGGEWPRERFRVHGIRYQPSEKTKSELFLECLALVNSGRAKIPNDPRLRAQFVSLERRTSRSGKDSIDHAPSGHDDLCNSAAGALVLAAGQSSRREPLVEVWDFSESPEARKDPHEGVDLNDPFAGDERFWHK